MSELCAEALNRPILESGYIPILRNYASSAIDISDGLVGDLGHILQRSGVGGIIDKSLLPVPACIPQLGRFDLALNGGDDYRLLFTVAPKNIGAMLQGCAELNLNPVEIGSISNTGQLVLIDGDKTMNLDKDRGFDHFAE
jgi:thiamine-monophosphate kinase